MKKTPLRRTASLPNGRTARRPRKASEWSRIYGSKARVAWVKSLGCLICGNVPSDNCHTEGGGVGRKAGYETIIPLCRSHHQALDEHRFPFSSEASRGTAKLWAIDIARRWQALQP